MEELKFKTTLSCGGCKNKITPGMNEIKGISNWEVDLDDTDKILTVQATTDVEQQIKEVFEVKGFEVTRI